MTYKSRLYQQYVSTHIVGRKVTTTLEVFRDKSIIWQSTLRRFLPQDKNARIADVGCGDGRVVWWLQQIGYANAEGVDVSLEQVEVAHRLGVENIYHADFKAFLKGKTDFYETLILRNIIEHFEKSEIIEILELCRYALKGMGRLIVQVPNAESPFFGRIRYGDFTHEVAFCSSSLTQVFNIVGLTDVECYPVEPLFRSRRSISRRFLWRAVTCLYKLLLFAELGPGGRIVSQDIMAVATKLDTGGGR